MKTFGKIIEFDGYNGYIKGVDGKEYLLMSQEAENPQELIVGDNVYFESELYETPEYKENIARFVKKLSKNEVEKKGK